MQQDTKRFTAVESTARWACYDLFNSLFFTHRRSSAGYSLVWMQSGMFDVICLWRYWGEKKNEFKGIIHHIVTQRELQLGYFLDLKKNVKKYLIKTQQQINQSRDGKRFNYPQQMFAPRRHSGSSPHQLGLICNIPPFFSPHSSQYSN